MNTQIDSAVKRARAYWFADGFTEIAAGGLFTLLAGLLLLSNRTSPSTFSSWFLSVAGKIAIAKAIGILVGGLALGWLKDHFTYPRTGYVRMHRVPTTQILIVIRNVILFLLLPIAGLLAISLLATSAGKVLSSIPIWLPVGVGLLWGILLGMAGEWMGLRRFRLLSAAMLLAGLAVGAWESIVGSPYIPVGGNPGLQQLAMMGIIGRALIGLGALVLVAGIILIFSGLLTFLRYQKENPAPWPEDA